MDRRRFLLLAGAAVVAPAAACSAPAVSATPSSSPTSSPGGSPTPAPAGPPPDYTLGAPTSELLARTPPRLVTESGTFTESYEQPAPADDTTWDMRGARFVGYFDADARYETGEFAGGSTAAQKNNRPIQIGEDAPVTGAALIGGVVEGAQPETLTWERMKYGQHVQDDTDAWVDAGRPADVDPHRNQVDNRNQDGDARMWIRPDGWAVWDGVRVRNTHDGIGVYGDFAQGSGTCIVRNCWLSDVHDDAFENDDWHGLHVLDTLVEGTYTFLSCQNHGLDGARPRHGVTVEHSVVRLRPFPGGYKTRSTDAVHGQIYKSQENGPALVLRHVVIAAERFRDPDDGPRLPERTGQVQDRYEDVTLVWLGPGGYPGNVPAGCRVTTDRAVYDRAVASWKSRHGVRADGGVDPDRMIAPEPVSR
ncbi:hypothetical protein ACI797_25585 [Geodermatophilus sp. SYSU D00691]